MKFLHETFDGNQPLIEFLQRAVGLQPHRRHHRAVLLLLLGHRLEREEHVSWRSCATWLGDYGYNMPFSTLELTARSAIPNDVAALVNRRLVTRLGNERVRAVERAAGEGADRLGFDHRPVPLQGASSPSPPRRSSGWRSITSRALHDDSHGFWRRVRLIPFLHKFEAGAQDKHLLSKLRAEAPGILAWAVQGCLKWQQEGLGMPEIVKAATESYREEMDIIGQFLEERCVVDPQASVAAATLWDEFAFWASENGEQADRRIFAARLAARGFEKRKSGHGRIWTWFGVTLNPLMGVAAIRGDADAAPDSADAKPPLSRKERPN